MSGQDVERDVAVVREARELAAHGYSPVHDRLLYELVDECDRLAAKLEEQVERSLNWRSYDERMQAENAKLREALERVMDSVDWLAAHEIARAALADPFLPIGHPTC